MSADAIEINFDGLVGPTHNFAALSLGNVASARHGGQPSSPREAALEGLEKMRTLLRLGLRQGFLPPLRRPASHVLARLGYKGTQREMLADVAKHDPELLARLSSASAMWTANAATVIAAPDSADGRVHLIAANLSTMFHRAIEHEETAANLARIFADERHFAVHPALPLGAHLGDEGAANHMRLAPSHGERGVNIFVYGAETGGRFPARQAERASRAVARIGGVADDAALFIRQASRAVQAGAFHNDVVAVANENVLLCHADAFEGGAADEARMRAALPGLHVLRVDGLSLEEAVQTYLFNSQLVTLPGDEGMALILPVEVREHNRAWGEVEAILAADNPVTRAIVVDVRGSMKNGGGPACLRLRVPVSRAALAGINPAFLLDEAKIDALARLVETHWPERISPADLADPALWDTAHAALAALEDWIAAC